MDTQEMLVSGAIFGIVASTIVAFIVLTFSTLNPYIAFLSIVNIAGVLVCILGLMAAGVCPWFASSRPRWSRLSCSHSSTLNSYVAFLFCAVGWEMGVIESISITVLVGLSIDYVVHLANSYIEAEQHGRMERVQASFAEMGVTVFGGAATSIGASAMLFLCYFQMFFKFGGFMFMTIVTSFLWANCFFMPILSLLGPQGNTCSFAPLLTKQCGSAAKQANDQVETSSKGHREASLPNEP
jgi:hypothetical protein